MSDPVDRGNDRAEEMLADTLAEFARHNSLHGKSVADSLHACECCAEPIPEARRVAVPGVRLCVDCQVDAERLAGRSK